MSVGSDDLLALLRRRGLASARELQDALGISQPTLSRLIARARSELVVVGRARSVRYAARDSRSTFFAGVPLHRVGGDGRVTAFGTLVPLASGGTALLRERGDSRTFAGLPWFVEELRPQGFLGRLSVRALVAELRLPPDARSWASDHLLQALSVRGDDLPGDLLVGDAALERYLRRRLEAPARVDRSEYARIIEAQLAGDMPGSSAGGEQPKFACFGGTPATELLVKYSPPIAESPAGRRWADLLCCEELALRVLGEGGLAVARAEYVEVDGRAFLEVDRFDRTEQGRIAVVTGALVDAEFVGSGAWVPLARGLAQQRRLSGADAETVQLLHLFGGLIGNTDM
ncbi:MAG: HipA domain-containing protein, partial [Polyangiales bacterium]